MDNISLIRSDVERLRLDGWEYVTSVPYDILKASYNGTGPEFLSENIRKRLDSITKPFLPAIMVHDLDFTRSDGTIISFNKANNRILKNCIKCAADTHPWYSWRRYALMAEAIVIYRACQKFGWIAWRSAYLKNKHKKETK